MTYGSFASQFNDPVAAGLSAKRVEGGLAKRSQPDASGILRCHLGAVGFAVTAYGAYQLIQSQVMYSQFE